jgi:DNA-binding LacI/PurR family transcriptional regulator
MAAHILHARAKQRMVQSPEVSSMVEMGRTSPAAGPSFVSAQDVARRAGVSRSAVSRTFTPGASVSSETRDRVMRAADELGYRVNHLARSLARRRTGIVCLVAADVETPNISRLVKAITRRLQEEQRVGLLLSLGGPSDDPATTLEQTFHYRADATIVLSGTPAESIVRRGLDSGQRLILINRNDPVEGPDHIRTSSEDAAQSALRAFMQAGCRRLAVVSSGRPTPSLLAREEAFKAGAAAEGLPVDVVREGSGSHYEGGLAAGRRLFAGLRPEAVFCVNDLMAFGVMDAARHDFGLDIPRELCVIGFDDIPQAEWLAYRLTTFEQPAEEIARAAVRLAVQDGEAALDPQMVTVSPRLVWRETVRR